ncbi:MAG: membrane protein insertase YidC [Terriglobia bacterium]
MAQFSQEKRILLAFAASFLLLALWGSYMRSRYPQPPPPAGEAPAPRSQPAPSPAPPRPTGAEAEALPATPPPIEIKQGAEERTITVEMEGAAIVFSTRGAVVQSWRLKKYQDERGEPLELVQGRQTRLGYPLSLAAADPQQEETLNRALFQVNTGARDLVAPVELVFEWSDGRLAARKRFRFDEDCLCEIETQLWDQSQPVEHQLAWRGGFGEAAGAATSMRGGEAQVFVRPPGGVERQQAGEAGKETGWVVKSPSPFPYTGEASYAGIEDRYFAAVFLPRRPQLRVTAWTEEWTPVGEEKAQQVGAVAVGVADDNTLRLFVGPKAIHVLEGIKAPAFASGKRPVLAEELVDFGWFWWVAKPLFVAMTWMYEHWIGNYGWVIILLTIVINMALFPLKWKSMLSAWKMQKVAPQVKAIQARYKQYKFNDPRKQQMQQEIMALYKQHGVNPVGGCLPMVLQIPFFFGFYKVLLSAFELRHAPWVFWITDLSQKDPYYVLPIVMTLTMFVSTRMTPMTTTDPGQQRLMRLFPLLFGFFFLTFPAGLVLYWLMSSVVGIGQQWWINKRQREHEMAEKEAAKELKRKKRHRHRQPASGPEEASK